MKETREERLHALLNRATAWLPEDHPLQAEIAAELSARSETLPPCSECDDTKEPRPCGAANCPFARSAIAATDTKRLDYLGMTLHIDATGDLPIYALYIPGTEGVKSKKDLRGLIDDSMEEWNRA
jgi:hypothetical protein